MRVVVVDHIPDDLVCHREERAKCSQTSEVHDVVKVHGVLQAFCDQAIRSKVGLDDSSRISLDLNMKKYILTLNIRQKSS